MYSLLKSQRLLKREDFRRLSQVRRKFYGNFLTIEYDIPKQAKQIRLGVTVTKKFGKAHVRNQFKRRIREIFRTQILTLPLSADVNVRAKPNTTPTFDQLKGEVMDFVQTLRPL